MAYINKEKAIRNAEVILEKIHSTVDVLTLKEYKKIYKKEISFFKRSWAAAWLFMYYDQKETPSMQRVKNFDKKDNDAQDEKTPIVEIPEEESKRLFISIGKNRRLFPREVITLIMTKTSTTREDIGSIRILDNYSFVQVRDNKADEIIRALNGIKFRGRTLAVNFAKPKTETD